MAQITKTGYVFVLDRRTGQPQHPAVEQPVPKSTIPNEQASPTQPVPTRPAPFARQQLDRDNLFGLTPLDCLACQRRFDALRNVGGFRLIEKNSVIVVIGRGITATLEELVIDMSRGPAGGFSLCNGLASGAGLGTGCLSTPETMGKTNLMSSRVKKGYLDGPFGQIHYYEAGQGPTLILAHQSPVSARQYEKALPLLGDMGIRAIAIDTPGYGNSDAPTSAPTIADYASLFPAVLSGLNLGSAHFLGHHTGAAILTRFAVTDPTAVKSLILNGPPLLTEEDLKPFKDIKHEPPIISDDGSHLQDLWDTRVRYTPGWTDKNAMHRRLVDQLWAGETVWHGHYAAFNYLMEPDFMALKVATMILANSGDDIYYLAQKAKQLRPDFAYQELTGGTHDIVDEQPEAWSRLVADFVLKTE